MCSKARGLRMSRGDRNAINPAVERREASALRYWARGASRKRVHARLSCAKRLRAYVTGPLKGAAAPERLSALRSLISHEGCWQTSESLCLARRMTHVGRLAVLRSPG
jgi:hypothetical protein